MNLTKSALLVFLACVCQFAIAKCDKGQVNACATSSGDLYLPKENDPGCRITVSEKHYCCPSNIPKNPTPRLGFAIRLYGCRANNY
ncbi:uncharacterized protein PGTG_16027 [Puccinia graminis f. sp. tritici CRL 75-36-700-3]|uniref:Uncharacterized protein n=1 Tax=Puccinia graminis f. sp. tritici (strain CRL 75-36-700-3 / race SCCL) TaxID=418459 RepID=E3L1L5_PUCGT|nr:uncharacterized protein PGTG_16027 [Puccinia graminis f. sp. tritici CRL 75-36-700-3]EFP90440.2 hypothetical protein PGTG_16027 [Puccinia graminis f. sp. tritici CRL 75-36-700-3]